MIRVLVVDDSAFMRKAISMMLESDPDVKVIDTARDGLEAIEKIKHLKPDVVTMDVEMPRMDGITALKKIMKENPCPVLMISSITKEGAQATVEALQAGAVDYIPKQSSYLSLEITKIQEELVGKIKAIVRSRSRLFRKSVSPPRHADEPMKQQAVSFRNARLIAIGVSTGGPFALQHVIPALPENLHVPVVVVQHMPPHFTRSLADRLNSLSPIKVVEAENGMRLEAGTVFIAAGGRHMVFQSDRRAGFTIKTPEEPSDTLHRPSVDVTFSSANENFKGQVLATVMTGMGRDGLEGAKAIKKDGGRVVAQDEASCVVYGMPRVIVEAGLADSIVPLDQIAPTIIDAIRSSAYPSRQSVHRG